jgi:hypothetical protein
MGIGIIANTDRPYLCDDCGEPVSLVITDLHPYLLHWRLNPGLAINEYFLGTRIPKRIHICESCFSWSTPQFGQYVFCPTCQTYHHGMTWSGSTGFGNWKGIICPDCSEVIPCTINVFTPCLAFLLSPLTVIATLIGGRRYRNWSAKRAADARQRRK